MKSTLLFSAIALVYCSCTEVQYLTVSSEKLSKDPYNNLVSENDTIRVQYKFKDRGGNIELMLFNKTAQPIEIDWRKSALIVAGKTESYFISNSTFTGRIQNDTLLAQRRNPSFGNPVYVADVSGIVSINEPVQFIPPHSFLTKTLQAVLTEPIPNLADQSAVTESVPSVDAEVLYYKRLHFSLRDSPISFRSYLTFRIGAGEKQKEFSQEHEFFISEIWKSASAPASFPASLLNRGDRFYFVP